MVDAGELKFELRDVLFSHPNTTVETILVEHINITEIDYHHFDLSNLTQSTTIRAFEKTDGTNYKLLAESVYPEDFTDGVQTVVIILNGGGHDMKITLQSAISEGSAKSIPGNVRDELRE